MCISSAGGKLPPPCAPRCECRPVAGTETVDFTAGAIRPQRDVVDDQMRPRPQIEWSHLRARLEIEFGIGNSELKKYDDVDEESMLKAYACIQCPRTRFRCGEVRALRAADTR